MGKVPVSAGLQRAGAVFAAHERSRNLEDGYQRGACVLLDRAAHVVAGYIRKPHVQNHEIRMRLGCLQSFASTPHFGAVVTSLAQNAAQYVAVFFPVIDDKDARPKIRHHDSRGVVSGASPALFIQSMNGCADKRVETSSLRTIGARIDSSCARSVSESGLDV